MQAKRTRAEESQSANTISPVIAGLDSLADPGLRCQLIKKAIAQNKAIFQMCNLSSPPMPGKMYKDGRLTDCISIYLKDDKRTNYPEVVEVNANGAEHYSIPVDYILNVSTAKIHSAAQAGSAIANINSIAFKGTVCCRLKQNDEDICYLLTCSHVMTNGSSENYAGQLDTPIDAVPFGLWVWAMRTSDIDAALIAIEDTDIFTYPVDVLAGKAPRALTDADSMATDIIMAGRDVETDALNLVTGKVVNYSSQSPIPIDYSEGQFDIENLIILAKITESNNTTMYETLSADGDSGALVYDTENNPIGMVIAGDNQFTYAIPFSTILLNTQTSIA